MDKMEVAKHERLDLDKPRFDQSTFEGRAKHFLQVTSFMNILASDAELDEAKQIVDSYRAGAEDKSLTDEDIWHAKALYDSAFHPQTGEKLFVMGRMSFQVPGNMVIAGCMMTFYKSTAAVIFWHWANQSYNAVVNYTNRNASASISNEQLGQAYGAAVSASVATALGFNKLVASSPALSNSLIGRFVPLVAVASANCLNIPLMRRQEVVQGIYIQDKDGNTVGKSGNAAVMAIKQVVPARVLLSVPAMVIPPLIMTKLEKTATFVKNPWLKAPVTVLLAGSCFAFATPLACAIFPQTSTIDIKEMEPDLQTDLQKRFPGVKTYFYNKGL